MSIPEMLRKRCEHELDVLVRKLPGLSAAVIASSDGFEIAAWARDRAEIPKLAAMACSISALGAMAGVESGIGRCQSVTIESNDGYVVIVEVPNPVFPLTLQLVAPSSEVLGQLIYLARRSAMELVRSERKIRPGDQGT